MVGHVAPMGEMRNAYKILVKKPGVKRPRVRPRQRWVNAELIVRKSGVKLWAVFMWLRIGTANRPL
jgi:hypothetical protein